MAMARPARRRVRRARTRTARRRQRVSMTASRSRAARAPTPVRELELEDAAPTRSRVVATTDFRTARVPGGGRTTAAAGLLAHGSSGFDAPSRGLGPQWHSTRNLAVYSCGNSRSFELRSLFGPSRG